MGYLTAFLQAEFARQLPHGWSCRSEVQVLPKELVNVLGYSSRVDILLEREQDSKKLWIEFEISRADPVANHAKFATSHLFKPQHSNDAFISMVSSHVTRGRRNLAANSISLMREVGMNAFQTVLLPQFSPREIKRINHLPQELILVESLDIKAEIFRAISVSEFVLDLQDRRLHFAGDFLEVFLNLRQWNYEILHDPTAQDKWGQRTITYFVFDPYSRKFAPSKFCAYSGIWKHRKTTSSLQTSGSSNSVMTVDFYTILDGAYSNFDGRRARIHLTNCLGMTAINLLQAPHFEKIFEEWLNIFGNSIRVHPAGPIFLLPPTWFK
ncbi:hypothetical protein [Nodosilinea sp. E11]|uniref:hypothetical protein n=1 Tax=Nodosilinea sp. E11 TaxID=3037479 RepID=UPI00293432BE|nr:hypothetical protein [Nodosilinea sp. E11]WOD40456.1 hypothetical protein RRF56_06575 [Nodosilinea sp. E11]